MVRLLSAAFVAILTVVSIWALLSLAPNARADATDPTRLPPTAASGDTVPLTVVGPNRALVGPVDLPRVTLSDDDWKRLLSPEQFRILRNAGTEPAFCGNLLDNHLTGVYTCAGCQLPLFSSGNKFNSGTGWPSFFQPVAATNITEHIDTSYMGIPRTEILCARCGGHLGHVFSDGPAPTGLRYCVNSESLAFVEESKMNQIQELNEIVFAGGCFWCVEAVFEQLDGVVRVESGYAGGTGPAQYERIVTGTTGYAESVRVLYNPAVISPAKLLEVHFATHDPTSLNRQGADVGPQYRSALFYHNDAEKALFERFINEQTAAKKFRNPIVTTVEPIGEFHLAEDYHQDYAANNPDNPYIRGVAKPKVDKARQKFSDLLKPQPGAASADSPNEAPTSDHPAGP